MWSSRYLLGKFHRHFSTLWTRYQFKSLAVNFLQRKYWQKVLASAAFTLYQTGHQNVIWWSSRKFFWTQPTNETNRWSHCTESWFVALKIPDSGPADFSSRRPTSLYKTRIQFWTSLRECNDEVTSARKLLQEPKHITAALEVDWKRNFLILSTK